MTNHVDNIIDASVSKSFFVDMLVRDIPLEMAIHDLLDNCVDGALNLRGNQSFGGLEVNITCSQEYFEIRDNCGGIDPDIARNYAFRFGRPKDVEPVPHSVGRFGVGMKRAVFKLGKQFTVSSTSLKHRFVVDVDVASWEERPEWQFEFKEMEEFLAEVLLEDRGTTVRVNKLLPAVSERFGLEYFVSRLHTDIQSRHQVHLDRGLVVRLNNRSIVGESVAFLESGANLRAGIRLDPYNGVIVQQIAGVGPRNPADAGWYVFCNGRMVLRADQSELTGWGEPGVERLPKYHNNYAWFRGCVFFDSEDSTALPWNTTKDGVDQDSGLYRTVRTQMVNMMTPVIQFLREVATEEEPGEPLGGVLESAFETSLTVLLSRTSGALSSSTQKIVPFLYSIPEATREIPPDKRPAGISYSKPAGIVNKVKAKFGVNSNRAVGEKTFEFYVDAELEE